MASLLSSHPQLHTGPLKEPRFFDLNYQQGLSYLEDLMKEARPEQLRGDCSPGYFHCPWVAERIQTHCPEAKFLVIFREPVARAYSNWWSKYSRGVEKQTFSECVEKWLEQRDKAISPLHLENAEELYRRYLLSEDTRAVPYIYYFDMGIYAPHLRRFRTLFQEHRVKTLSFQALIREPNAVLQECAEFLNISPDEFPSKHSAKNQSAGPVASKVRKLAHLSGLNRIVPISLQKSIGHLFRNLGDDPPRLDPVLKSRLQEIYEPHNLELKKLLGHLPWESPFLLKTS